MFLLDTNVISEAVKPRPNHHVLAFLHETDEDRFCISVITLAEIGRGIALLPPSRRRTKLESWLQQDVASRFASRILPIDEHIAYHFAELTAKAQKGGAPLYVMDAFLAATAVTKGQVLVTRNDKDFASLGIAVFNPWMQHRPAGQAGAPW